MEPSKKTGKDLFIYFIFSQKDHKISKKKKGMKRCGQTNSLCYKKKKKK